MFPENPAPGFSHKLVRDGPRLLIRSTCAQCGASEVVSEADASLELWEDGHRCVQPGPAADEPHSQSGLR